MMSVVGLLFWAAAIWCVFRAYKFGQELEEEKFDRTNKFGVEEFDSFKEKKMADRREGANKLQGASLGCIALFLTLLGFIFFFGGLAMNWKGPGT